MSLGRDSFIPAGLRGSFRSPQTTTCSQLMRAAPGSGNFSASIYWAHVHVSGFSTGWMKSLWGNWRSYCQAEISWVAQTTSGFDVPEGWDIRSTTRISWGYKLNPLVQWKNILDEKIETTYVESTADQGLWDWIQIAPALPKSSLKSRLRITLKRQTNKQNAESIRHMCDRGRRDLVLASAPIHFSSLGLFSHLYQEEVHDF